MKPNKELFQYDINQSLSGCTGKYIEFIIDEGVVRVQVENETCLIPDELLQIAGDHTVYQTYEDGTISEHRLFVYGRPKPPDYIYTPTEKLTFDGLVQRVNDAVSDLEQLKSETMCTDEELLNLLVSMDVIQPMVDETGAMYVNQSEALYVL